MNPNNNNYDNNRKKISRCGFNLIHRIFKMFASESNKCHRSVCQYLLLFNFFSFPPLFYLIIIIFLRLFLSSSFYFYFSFSLSSPLSSPPASHLCHSVLLSISPSNSSFFLFFHFSLIRFLDSCKAP